MALEDTKLDLLNKLFEEAVGLHREDSRQVARYVEAQIAALSPEDRVAIDGAFEQMLAFRAPDFRSEPLN